MTVISSLQNARIKQIRALTQRKYRQQTGLFLIEGVLALTAAIQSEYHIAMILYSPEANQHTQELITAQRQQGIECLAVTHEVFASIATRELAHGVAAVVSQRWYSLDGVRLQGQQCWLALEAVQYPGNLGTIIRTAAAVGVAGIILLGTTTDPYDPLSVRASAGGLFAPWFIRTTIGELQGWKERFGIFTVGTSPAATLDYRLAGYARPILLLMGGERSGLSPAAFAMCDQVVSIPMTHATDSLNLAVATGVMLYEFVRQG